MTKSAAFFDLDKTLLGSRVPWPTRNRLYQSGMLTRQDLMRSAYGQFVYLVAGANAAQNGSDARHMSELVTRVGCGSRQAHRGRGAFHRHRADRLLRSTPRSSTNITRPGATSSSSRHQGRRSSNRSAHCSGPIKAIGNDRDRGRQIHRRDPLLRVWRGQGPKRSAPLAPTGLARDLSASYAYSDSMTDLPMLEAVGHPVATNPDKELRAIAKGSRVARSRLRKPVAMAIKDARNRAAGAAGVAVGAVALGPRGTRGNRRKH